jgi:UDP-N-acetylglucosamine--N-acetylmuramyl-(pentapeptide) pyrophosphoryl-undecaprenol N-acetylglucosamine transferase
MKCVIVAGATGGHIFPALAVALELRRRYSGVSLEWIGTARSRERDLCAAHGIAFRKLDVTGIRRTVSLDAVKAAFLFSRGVMAMRSYFRNSACDAVVAFGGYVSAPVLTAARMCAVPYFLHEQNTVPGLVNRLFAGGAECTFLGFALADGQALKGATKCTGTPVRRVTGSYAGFAYPKGFDAGKQSVLISGGSQGAASMNSLLLGPVRALLDSGMQVVWQTGPVSYNEVAAAVSRYGTAFVFDHIDDMYPFYARSKCVICRAGASTLSEAAYFGIPCIMVPLPWATENHQWINAGLVESQGWGVRIAQEDGCGEKVVESVTGILTDTGRYELMCRKALDHSPVNSAGEIVSVILEKLGRTHAHSS